MTRDHPKTSGWLLVTGCGTAHKPRPLHVNQWNGSHTSKTFFKDGLCHFKSFSSADVSSCVYFLSTLVSSVIGQRRGGGNMMSPAPLGSQLDNKTSFTSSLHSGSKWHHQNRMLIRKMLHWLHPDTIMQHASLRLPASTSPALLPEHILLFKISQMQTELLLPDVTHGVNTAGY